MTKPAVDHEVWSRCWNCLSLRTDCCARCGRHRCGYRSVPTMRPGTGGATPTIPTASYAIYSSMPGESLMIRAFRSP
jgi:hypothetical protein